MHYVSAVYVHSWDGMYVVHHDGQLFILSRARLRESNPQIALRPMPHGQSKLPWQSSWDVFW